jgi:hypothetical protein
LCEWNRGVVARGVRKERGKGRAERGIASQLLITIVRRNHILGSRKKQRTSAAVCKMESNPNAATPLRNMPNRNPWYSALKRVGHAVPGMSASAMI